MDFKSLLILQDYFSIIGDNSKYLKFILSRYFKKMERIVMTKMKTLKTLLCAGVMVTMLGAPVVTRFS